MYRNFSRFFSLFLPQPAPAKTPRSPATAAKSCKMVWLAIIVFCTGCATTEGEKAPVREQVGPPPAVTSPAAKPMAPAVEVKCYVHTVRWTGETVSIIAGWYTGDIQNWRILAESNPDIDPNKVHLGMQIRIPEIIMTTKAPMTREHVDSFYTKAKKRTGRTPSARPEADESKAGEVTLFGPK